MVCQTERPDGQGEGGGGGGGWTDGQVGAAAEAVVARGGGVHSVLLHAGSLAAGYHGDQELRLPPSPGNGQQQLQQ